jgi:hypothetical protein
MAARATSPFVERSTTSSIVRSTVSSAASGRSSVPGRGDRPRGALLLDALAKHRDLGSIRPVRGYLLFQLFFAIMFMIVQFAALFWFLGRTGSTGSCREGGVGFKDYGGNRRSSSWPSGS